MDELSKTEYERILQVAEAALQAERPEDWWHVASDAILGPLFHADVFALATIDHRQMSGRFLLIRPSWAEISVPTGSQMHDELLAGHPFTEVLGLPSGPSVVRVTALVSPLAWRQMAGFSKMRELISATNHLSVSVDAAPGWSVSCSPIRAGKDFSEHEVHVGRRIQPLLRAAGRHVHYKAEQRRGLGAEEVSTMAEAAADLKLTSREQVILGIMAHGASTAAIARRLGVSPRTVAKHQEHLYRKLGVADRLTAVVRAQELGLIGSVPRERSG